MKTSMRTSIVSGGKKEKRRSPAMPKSDEGGEEGIFVPLPRTGILPYTDQKKQRRKEIFKWPPLRSRKKLSDLRRKTPDSGLVTPFLRPAQRERCMRTSTYSTNRFQFGFGCHSPPPPLLPFFLKRLGYHHLPTTPDLHEADFSEYEASPLFFACC